MTTKAPIVMVHGAFCGAWAFEGFEKPFLRAGFEVHRPNLRGHAPDDPPQAVANLSMSDYARDIAAFCDRLARPPVLIGHSMGGLVAQLVAARRPVAALALLAPSAPWGVTTASLDEALAALGAPFLGPLLGAAVPPSREMMLAYGLDRVSPAQRDAALARLRPESGRALAQTLTWWTDPFMATSIGPGPLKSPSLALVGEHDRIHAPASVRRTAERIGARFHILPDAGHWLPAEPGAGQAAQMILDWLPVEAPA